jgi:hypothetical protein
MASGQKGVDMTVGKDAAEQHENGSQVSPLSPLRPDWSPRHWTPPRTVAEAVELLSMAAQKRAIADALAQEPGDTTAGGVFERAEAADMEKRAQAYFDIANHTTGPVSVGNGGELVVETKEAWQSIPGVICTVRDTPDMLTATASRQRLELTGNSLPMAVDAAESIQAKNSLEKMLAHELAAAHRLAMNMAEQSVRLVERFDRQHETLSRFNPAHSVEAARLANASARMMGAFQDGLLALDRIRRGRTQTVKVVHQHVAVASGGQAVVAAGGVRGGGTKTRGRGRK